jgi:carboxymethylenebutenolidase
MAASQTTHTIDTPDGPMEAYEALPDGRALGAIIVIQEAFGLNEHVRDVTRRMATEGYHAIAPALFHRSGGGTAPYDDFSKVMPLFEGFDDRGVLVDVDATREHLERAGFRDSQIGLVGFCMGGRVSFLVAARRELGAVVGFYGGGIVTSRRPQLPALIEESAALKAPWLGLFGDQDEGIPVEDVEKLRTALEGARVPTQVVRYADAEHGFHCNERPSYNESAAKDGWARMLDWFREHLGPS